MLRLLASLCLLGSLTACGGSSAGIRAACGTLAPMPSYSSKDTKETIFWFEGTEAYPGYAVRWKRICGDG